MNVRRVVNADRTGVNWAAVPNRIASNGSTGCNIVKDATEGVLNNTILYINVVKAGNGNAVAIPGMAAGSTVKPAQLKVIPSPLIWIVLSKTSLNSVQVKLLGFQVPIAAQPPPVAEVSITTTWA